MKKNEIFIFILGIFVVLSFLSSPAYAGHRFDQQIFSPGVGKEPESGFPPEFGHENAEYERSGRIEERTTMMRGADRMAPSYSVRASEYLDRSVFSRDGERIGRIEDLVFSNNGMLHYAIISTATETPNRYAVIPFGHLESTAENSMFTVRLDKEAVENAPVFSRQELADWRNPELLEEVHSYYGSE